MHRSALLFAPLGAALLAALAARADELPMPRDAADPAAIKGSADSVALMFARQDAERWQQLAEPLQQQVDQAAKKLAEATASLKTAQTTQAAAAKEVAAFTAALKQATADKAAADKALTAAKQTLAAATKAAAAEEQAKQAAEKAAKEAAGDADQSASQQAADKLAAARKASAEAKQQVASATAAAKATAKLLQDVTSRQKAATAAKAAADKEAARATAALKPLNEAKAAAEKAAAPTVQKLTAARERAALYAAESPSADPASTRLMATFKHDRPILSCRFSLDGQNIFFGARDNQLHRTDIITLAAKKFEGHRSWIRRIAVHPDGNRLISGAYGGRLMWWNLDDEKPAPTKEVAAHKGFVRAVALSPDGRLVATGGNDGFVRIWSADDGGLVAEIPAHDRHVYNVAFHPSGQHLVSGDLMGLLKQWEVGTWKHVRDFDCSVLTGYDKKFRADCGGIRGMAFSPDGESLVVSGISNVTNAFAGVGTPTAVLFDWQSGKRLNVFLPATSFRGTCWGVRFHPSGEFVIGAGGGSGGGMWFWKPGQDKSFHDVKLPNVAYDIALHPDGLRAAVALYDRTIRIYNMGPKTETEKAAEAKAAAAAAAKKKKEKKK